MKGWIALHRQIMDGWIFQDAKYLKWWCTILMCVNHKATRFPAGTNLHTCKPGESYRSIETWAGLFGCSKRSAFKFLQLLESDDMITRKTVGKGNRRKHLLSVVKWEEFQVNSNPKLHPIGNRKSTPNNNDYNDDNNMNGGIGPNGASLEEPITPRSPEVAEFSFTDFIALFNEITERSYKGDTKSKSQFRARSKEGYSLDDFSKAVTNCAKSKYHTENPQYLTPEFITRPDKLERYLNFPQPMNGQPRPQFQTSNGFT